GGEPDVARKAGRGGDGRAIELPVGEARQAAVGADKARPPVVAHVHAALRRVVDVERMRVDAVGGGLQVHVGPVGQFRAFTYARYLGPGVALVAREGGRRILERPEQHRCIARDRDGSAGLAAVGLLRERRPGRATVVRIGSMRIVSPDAPDAHYEARLELGEIDAGSAIAGRPRIGTLGRWGIQVVVAEAADVTHAA